MLKSFNILLCLTFLISNLTYASNKSIKLDYENVLVKKHQFINNKEISIINGYGMCALPTQYPCEITVNQVDKLLLSFKSSNQIELTYIQTNHISNEN